VADLAEDAQGYAEQAEEYAEAAQEARDAVLSAGVVLNAESDGNGTMTISAEIGG
jgi:hypothetical protein